MDYQYDGIQFIHYVRRRLSVILVSCAIAVSLSAGVCLILPKRYTATASILIEPPAGNDPRGATAVSPVYLESLKTYERFASSDSVFIRSLRTLGLQDEFTNRDIESVKRSVLKVSRPTSTRIIEISATLAQPQSAQRLAQNIAEQSVALNRRLIDQSSGDLLNEMRRSAQVAETRLKSADRTQDEILRTQRVDALQNEVNELNQLKITVGQDLGKTRAELADMQAEIKTFKDGDGMEAQAQWTRRQIDALEARVKNLSQQLDELGSASGAKAAELESRKQRREAVTLDLRSARADYESARAKLSEAQNSAAFHGERLEIMDPGIVPEHPSSPNIPLNLMIAIVLSLLASLTYLAVRFGYSRERDRIAVHEYGLR